MRFGWIAGAIKWVWVAIPLGLVASTDILIARNAYAQDGGTADASVASSVAESVDELPLERRPTLEVEVERVPTNTGESSETGEASTTAGTAPRSEDDQDTIRLGDLVRLRILVDMRLGDDVTVGQPRFPGFEWIGRRRTERSANEEGRSRRHVTLDFMLVPVQVGTLTINPIELRVITQEGNIGAVSTRPTTVVVRSVLGNEPQARLRGASPPVEVWQEDLIIAYIAAGVVSAALLIWLTLFIRRRLAMRPKPVPPPPPQVPAWDIAFGKLRELRTQFPDFVGRDATREFADSVGDVLREYLGGRFGFNGLESTTDEVSIQLRRVNLRGVDVHEVESILRESDFIKFAKATPDAMGCERMLDDTARLVRLTMPAHIYTAPNESHTMGAPTGGPA